MMKTIAVSRNNGFLYVWLGDRYIRFDKEQAAILFVILYEFLLENEE